VESDSYSQNLFPVSGSNATMRLYGEDKYNMPPTTNGVACDALLRGGAGLAGASAEDWGAPAGGGTSAGRVS
jgi:hypothetical protein